MLRKIYIRENHGNLQNNYDKNSGLIFHKYNVRRIKMIKIDNAKRK